MIIAEKMDKLLQQETVEMILYKKANPQLSMLNVFETQNLDGKKHFAFATKRKSTEDSIMEGILPEPVELDEESEFPQVQVTGIEEESGNVSKLGFEVKFSNELVKSDTNLAFVKNTLSDMGYAMGRVANRHIYQTIIANADVPTLPSPVTSWTDPDNEDIDTNIKEIQRNFVRQSGYNYKLTDMLVSQESYWGAEDYYEAIRPQGFDPNNVRGSRLQGIYELESGLIGYDASINSGILYYNVDSEDNTWNEANGSFINVNRVDQDDEHPKYLKFQMYMTIGAAITEPRAWIYQQGI